MPRRSTHLLLVLALVAAASPSGCRRRTAPSSAPPEPPARVVLVTIDTLRADHVGFEGYFRPTTPFLDRLAAEGTVFSACSSASSLTGPSHASMLTGVFPPQHGIVTNAQALDPPHATLPAALGDAGWQTAAFTGVRFLQQLSLGFDSFHPAPEEFRPAGSRADEAAPFRRAEETVDAVLDWWRDGRDPARPTFLWVHFFDVHEAKGIEIDPELARGSSSDPGFLDRMREHLRSDMPYGERHLAVVDGYDTRILEVDRALRRLHGAIEGASEGAGVWIFTSDHGEGLGSHGFFGHGKLLYEEQLRVPLLVHASDGRVAARRVEALVRTIDLAPTIAELAGAAFAPRPLDDPALDARSLAPWLDGGRDEFDRIAFALRRPANDARLDLGWEAGVLAMARTRRHKLIDHSDGRDELFDLRSDPDELKNLLPSGAAAEDAVERLRGALATVFGAAAGEAATSEEFLEELEQLGYLK